MKAALYVRVSTDAQAERYSLPAQKRLLTDYATQQGWKYELYEDAGISGETLAARPAMRRLLEDAKAGRIQVAVSVEMERFSRSESLFDWLVIKQAFREGRVRFGTAAQLFDPADTEDDFLTDLFGALAKREKRKIVERTRRGKEEAARRGRYLAPHAPYGYQRGPNCTLVVYEPEARIVRWIFAQVSHGWSTRKLVEALRDKQIPSPRGGKLWDRTTVARLLKHPVYRGVSLYHRKQPAGEQIPVPVPRLVSDVVFHHAAQALRKNAVLSPRNEKRRYLLKGLVLCGVCGRTMVGASRGTVKQPKYQCTQRTTAGAPVFCKTPCLDVETLEALVWEQVCAALRHPETILEEDKRYRESHVSDRDEWQMRLAALRTALSQIPTERERVQTLFAEGYATAPEVAAQLSRIERKAERLRGEQATLEGRVSGMSVQEEEAARLARLVRRVAHRLTSLSDGERFEIIHAVVRRIVVMANGTVDLEMLVKPSSQPKRYREATYSLVLPSGRLR